MKSVAFIIIAYHPDTATFTSLLNILRGRDVIVVDNGNTLSQDFAAKSTLLTQIKNLGYGAAANIGIRHAIAHHADWFVVLNQDITMTKKSVADLVKKLNALGPCIAGPFTGTLDTRRWTTKFSRHHIVERGKLMYVSGSCIAIHEHVVTKVGYFYEPYFLYYEEVDYCMRARRAGFSIRRLAVDDIRHTESLSLGRGSRAHQYYLARNHLLFVERQAPASVRARESVRLPKTVTEHIRRRQRGALLGIRDYFFRMFGPFQGGNHAHRD